MESAWMSINWCMDNENVAHQHHGLKFSTEEESNHEICRKMYRTGKCYTKRGAKKDKHGPPCWLVFIVMKVFFRLLEEKSHQQSHPGIDTPCCTTKLTGKTCPLVQWWHECPGGNQLLPAWTWGLFCKRTHMLNIVELAKNLWIERSQATIVFCPTVICLS